MKDGLILTSMNPGDVSWSKWHLNWFLIDGVFQQEDSKWVELCVKVESCRTYLGNRQ